MSGNNLFCDTNILIHLLNNHQGVLELLTGSKIYISSITELELYGKRNLSDKEITILDELTNQCIVIDLIEPIKEIVKKLKQKHSIKLPDAIIAAS